MGSGGHEKANPKSGGKGAKLRGDIKSEKKRGRKRMHREYRKKGPSVTSLTDEKKIYLELDDNVIKTIYLLHTRYAYGGEKRCLTCKELAFIRNMSPDATVDFIDNMKEKLRDKKWLVTYSGIDKSGEDVVYIHLNIEEKTNIEAYLKSYELSQRAKRR